MSQFVSGGSVRSLWFLSCFSFFISSTSSFAGLMVHPMRVVIEKDQRGAAIDLMSVDSKPGSYRIVLENRRMNENGDLEVVKEPKEGELFADKLLQFSPRQVELEPGAGQAVRVMVRKPANLPPGEYRSHIIFQSLGSADDTALKDETEYKKGQLGVSIKTLVAISIPIIVRHGETQAEVKLSNPKLIPATKDRPPIVEVGMERTGNRSVFGEVNVEYVPKSGKSEEVGRVAGVAVYVPNPKRVVKIAIRPKTSGLQFLPGSKFVLTYREPKEAGGKLLAKTELVLP
jgi:hypothetical protein